MFPVAVYPRDLLATCLRYHLRIFLPVSHQLSALLHRHAFLQTLLRIHLVQLTGLSQKLLLLPLLHLVQLAGLSQRLLLLPLLHLVNVGVLLDHWMPDHHHADLVGDLTFW